MEIMRIPPGTKVWHFIDYPNLLSQDISEETDLRIEELYNPVFNECTVERGELYHRCEQHELIKLIWE